MTFLSPGFLWFLPLITLPIIIHLLAKQRSKLIDFPSLKFLKLLEQDALRKFNIKRLILLIIRTLMILLIVLSFARPNMNQQNGFSFNTRSVDLIILALDNTASNHANIDALKKPWLSTFKSDLEEKGNQVFYTGIADFVLAEKMGSIQPGYSNIYPLDISKRLSNQIDLERFRQKTIIWLGDGQDVQMSLESMVDWDHFIFQQPVNHDGGVASIELPTQGLRQGQEYLLNIGLAQPREMQKVMNLQLMVNENRQNQTVLELGQNFIEMTAKVVDSGFQEGQLEVANDDQPYNDMRYFLLPAAGNTPVQIIRTIQGLDYWTLMQESVSKMDLNLDLRLLSFSDIDNLNLSQGGTVIVDDLGQLNDYNWKRLKTFIQQGGQVIGFGNGGEHLNTLLDFRVPLQPENNQLPFGIYPVSDMSKQILDVPTKTAIGQNRLKIFKRFDVGAGELNETWVRFLDDQPFLGANNFGEGRLVWFNTEFGLSAANLPLLGVFPTLMVQLIQTQNKKNMTEQFNVEIGDTIHFLPQSTEGENVPFSIQRPDGTMDYQAPDSNYTIHYAKTNLPGVYHLMQGRQALDHIAVNISTHEALAHAGYSDIDESIFFVTEVQSELIREVLDRRSGIALWPLLLSILLLLWVIETYLSRIKSTWRKNV